ncbi:MAG: hypothetical protein ACOC8H_01280 [bacterium]
MSTTSPSPTTGDWTDLILATADASATWQGIFTRLRDLALADPGPVALHRQTVVPDRLLAEAAWNLWEDFPRCAPTVVDELKQFWVKSASAGSAVLVLDGLSLRELPMIVGAGRGRGIESVRIEVRGSEVPTETDRFAQALGLPGRSKLYNNQPPATFVFSGPEVYTDLFDQPFADCVSSVPSSPRIFIWHKWPDEPLIHLHEDKKDGPSIVAADTKKLLTDDAFWAFVDRLRQGRRLVITADHGYANSNAFSNEVKNEESVKLLRQFFGAKRCAKEDPANPWPRRNLPPLVCRHEVWLVVMGQRKWVVQGGFPHLCHRGLSLLEAAVPFIEYPPK